MAVRRQRRRFTDEDERQDAIAEAVRLHLKKVTQYAIAAQLGVSQPTVHMWLKKYGPHKVTVQELVAQRIREDMVCCDIYERMGKLEPNGVEWRAVKRSSDYHDICFYGEWSARIAEGVGK